MVLPSGDLPEALESVPGLWPTGATEGQIMLCNVDVTDVALDTGAVIAEVVPASVQTRTCTGCGFVDTDGWIANGQSNACEDCGVPRAPGKSSCRRCGAGHEHQDVLGYSGCRSCRPEFRPRRERPQSGMMQKSVLMAATLCSVIGSGSMTDIVEHPVFHIVEEPGAIDHMADCEVPTEEYYDALKEDMSRRHPKASKFMLEHLSCLETFLDTSIIAGFSFGIVKAQIAVTEGNLLGHRVKRSGISHDPEKTQAIRDFAVLKEPSHVRQFLGSTNWIRLFMPAPYAAAVKILGEWNKPGGEFGSGIGHPNGTTKGDKVVRVIKLMAQNCIERAVMDEAGAIDGSRPLEQIADACGYAWGGTIVQMTGISHDSRS